MIRALNENEQFVFNVFMEAKRKSHKFNVPYLYTIETENVKIISHILVAMNVGVHIKSMREKYSEIAIFHLRAKNTADLTYCRELRFDDNFSINITEEQKQEVKESINVILNALRFDDSFSASI